MPWWRNLAHDTHMGEEGKREVSRVKHGGRQGKTTPASWEKSCGLVQQADELAAGCPWHGMVRACRDQRKRARGKGKGKKEPCK